MLVAMQAVAGGFQPGQMASLRNKQQYLLRPQRKWIWMALGLDEPLGLRTRGAASADQQVLER